MEVGPQNAAADVIDEMKQVVMVHPVDPEIGEAHHIDQELGKPGPERIPVGAVWDLELQDHDRDQDGEHAIGERFEPYARHWEGIVPEGGGEPGCEGPRPCSWLLRSRRPSRARASRRPSARKPPHRPRPGSRASSSWHPGTAKFSRRARPTSSAGARRSGRGSMLPPPWEARTKVTWRWISMPPPIRWSGRIRKASGPGSASPAPTRCGFAWRTPTTRSNSWTAGHSPSSAEARSSARQEAIMEYTFDEAIPILTRTPAVLRAWLSGLPEPWLQAREGPDTWTPHHILSHLIHGERTDWIPRIEHVLEHGDRVPFPAFDQEGSIQGAARPMSELVETFAELRRGNLERLSKMKLGASDLARKALHPELGPVTLGMHLSTWVVHDLGHISQIARVMTRQYKEAVGPWRQYFSLLRSE